MKALIEGEATPAQVGAFLMAMRIKMESVTELASMTAAARSYVAPCRSRENSASWICRAMRGSRTPFMPLRPPLSWPLSAGAVGLDARV